MFLPDTQSKLITAFNGSDTRRDPYNVAPNKGLLAQNVAYLRGGQVMKRLGHSTVYNLSDGQITTLFDWWYYGIGGTTPVPQVVFYSVDGTGVYVYNQKLVATSKLMTASGASGATFVADGTRLYAAFFDITGRAPVGIPGGTDAVAQVFQDPTSTDDLWVGPPTNTISGSETGAGVIT